MAMLRLLYFLVFTFQIMRLSKMMQLEQELEVDKLSLSECKNILYAVMGSRSFLINTILKVYYDFGISMDHFHVFDASVDNEISQKINLIKTSSSGFCDESDIKLIVIEKLERVNQTNNLNINFVYRISDSYFKQKNLIVLLSFEDFHFKFHKQMHDMRLNNSNQEYSWKEFLSSWSNDASHFLNGNAFAGRISKAFIQAEEELQDGELFDFAQDPDQISNMHKEEYDPEEDLAILLKNAIHQNKKIILMDFSTFLALVSIVVIIYLTLKKWFRYTISSSSLVISSNNKQHIDRPIVYRDELTYQKSSPNNNGAFISQTPDKHDRSSHQEDNNTTGVLTRSHRKKLRDLSGEMIESSEKTKSMHTASSASPRRRNRSKSKQPKKKHI